MTSDFSTRLCNNPDCGHHELDHHPILGCGAPTMEVFCTCEEYQPPSERSVIGSRLGVT